MRRVIALHALATTCPHPKYVGSPEHALPPSPADRILSLVLLCGLPGSPLILLTFLASPSPEVYHLKHSYPIQGDPYPSERWLG